jgi:hypothetical protein
MGLDRALEALVSELNRVFSLTLYKASRGGDWATNDVTASASSVCRAAVPGRA